MKKKLREKLELPEINRNFLWFWKTHIGTKCSYSNFMSMLSTNHPLKLRDDIRDIINEYINES